MDLNFGNSGEKWNRYNEPLFSLIHPFYCSSLPKISNDKEISNSIEKILSEGEKKGTRTEDQIKTHAWWMALRNPLFGKTIPYRHRYKDYKIIALREHTVTPILELSKEDWAIEYHFDDYSKTHKEGIGINGEKWEKSSDSEISFIPISEEDDVWKYTYPYDVNADYADIFFKIFNIPDDGSNNITGDRDSCNWEIKQAEKTKLHEKKLFYFDNSKQKEIHLEGFIKSIAFFLIDFLLAGISASILESKDSGNRSTYSILQKQQTKDVKEITEFVDKLNKFIKATNYHNSQLKEICNVLSCQNINLFSSGKNVYAILLKNILDSFCSIEGTIRIPKYNINLSRVFELYVYYEISRRTAVQYKPKKLGRRPDMVDNTNDIIYEVKYKPSYQKQDKLTKKDEDQRKVFIKDKDPSKYIIVYPLFSESNHRPKSGWKGIYFPRNMYQWRSKAISSYPITDWMEYVRV